MYFESIGIEVWNKYAHFDKFLICDIYKPPSGTTEHLVDFTNKFTQWAAAINEKSKKNYICVAISILTYYRYKQINTSINSMIA